MTAKGHPQFQWTVEEDELIRLNRQSLSARGLTNLLPRRSWHAVRSRIKHLDIAKETRVSITCDSCGSPLSITMYAYRKYESHYCGDECKFSGFLREGNPYWRGGVSEQNGYVMVREPVSELTPYKREHRIIAETMIGRKLRADEIVHHKNGNKSDNSPENLEVMSRAEHSKLHWLQGDFNNRRRCN